LSWEQAADDFRAEGSRRRVCGGVRGREVRGGKGARGRATRIRYYKFL
jgi:hypothetical protein